MIPDQLDTMNPAIKKNSHNETHVIVILLPRSPLRQSGDFGTLLCIVIHLISSNYFFSTLQSRPNVANTYFFPYNCATQAKKYVVFFHKTSNMHSGTLFPGRFHVSLILDSSPLKWKKIQCF